MTGKKRRGLTDEEAALWRAVRDSVRPMRPPALTATAPAALAPDPPGPAPKLHPVRLRRLPKAGGGTATLDLAPDPATAFLRAHPRMDRRRYERLKRGKLVPEARLDLHGLTRSAAQDALTGFILGAHAAGMRLVLVITGKGRAGEGERPGILRHSLAHWLAAPPLVGRVLEVVPAHQRHGGGGAFYVYLRRGGG